MKQFTAFLSTLIIILLIGIAFLLGRRSATGGLNGTVGSLLAEAENVFSSDSSASGTAEGSKSAGTSDKSDSPAASGDNSSESAASAASSKRQSKANPITKAVVEKAVDTYIDTADSGTKEIFESMSEDDKDVVTDIIAENVSLSAIAELQSMAANGDKDALEKYAQENLSSEDQKTLKEIMSKYTD